MGASGQGPNLFRGPDDCERGDVDARQSRDQRVGTIGKRVTDSVSRQDDIRVVGVTKMKPNCAAGKAAECGYATHATMKEVLAKFEKPGIVAGSHRAVAPHAG